MNIRPIDLQSLMPQTLEVGKVKALDNLQLNQNQQAFNEQLQKETDVRSKKVIGSDKSEGKLVKSKDKESEAGGKKREKEHKNADEPEEKKPQATQQKVSDGVRGTRIDISY